MSIRPSFVAAVALLAIATVDAVEAQPRDRRITLEPLLGVQLISRSAGPLVRGCPAPWRDSEVRAGVRVAVRPWARWSRLAVEAQGTVAPPADGTCTLSLLPLPPGTVGVISRQPEVGIGDGRGPMGSLRLGVDVLRGTRGAISAMAGVGAMHGLGRPLGLVGVTGALNACAVRVTAGAEWMRTSVPLTVVATSLRDGVALSTTTTRISEPIAGALVRVGVQWPLGRAR